MKVKKIFNNNILLVEDERMNEIILMGRGIGFSKQIGDDVEEAKIEKIFRMSADIVAAKFAKLVSDIPINHLEVTKQIIEFAEDKLNTKFDDMIFIGLADHLSYALKRAKMNEQLKNALLWEIQKFYKKEYEVAIKALEIVKYHEGIELSIDEASFIAMHFVNGQQNGEAIKSTAEATTIIQDILNIVKFHYCIELDESSINYSRFITHIRFFLQRLTQTKEQTDDFLFLQVSIKYPDTYECAKRIKIYLDSKLNIDLNNEEMLYFMLHIQRLTEREKTK